MKIIRAHRIALDPNNRQRTYFAKAAGVARFTWNWALAEWNAGHERGEITQANDLAKKLNAIRGEQFPWMLDVSWNAQKQVFQDLRFGFMRFMKKQSRHPVFRSKKHRDSFRADNGPPSAGEDAVKIEGHRIWIPRCGWVRLREALRFKGQIKSAVVSRTAHRWFVSLAVEFDWTPERRENQAVVGVDLGVSCFATLSTGEKIEGPKPLRRMEKRIARWSRAFTRKKEGSKNRLKATRRMARLHARIVNLRNDCIHKLTARLVRDFDVVSIEDLLIKGMLRNRRTARSVHDMGLHRFRSQVEYKAKMSGCRIHTVDRFFPSSKLCSSCGVKNTALRWQDRSWKCACGAEHDRDLNAARNLAQAVA